MTIKWQKSVLSMRAARRILQMYPQPFDWDALLGLLHKKAPWRSSYEAQLSDSDSLVTTTQIAKEYGCGAKVFNRLLHAPQAVLDAARQNALQEHAQTLAYMERDLADGVAEAVFQNTEIFRGGFRN